MTEILALDQHLFHLINGVWVHPWLDAIMPYWREKETWVPFYALLAVLLAWTFRVRVLYFILAVALTVTVADTLSSKVVKPMVERLRPCNDPEVRPEVELRIDCGPGFSFPSSHATNHFAVATLFFMTLGGMYRLMGWPIFLWAGSIAYGQVYVGVHYPFDVFFGAFLGLLVGWSVGALYLRYDRFRLTPSSNPS